MQMSKWNQTESKRTSTCGVVSRRAEPVFPPPLLFKPAQRQDGGVAHHAVTFGRPSSSSSIVYCPLGGAYASILGPLLGRRGPKQRPFESSWPVWGIQQVSGVVAAVVGQHDNRRDDCPVLKTTPKRHEVDSPTKRHEVDLVARRNLKSRLAALLDSAAELARYEGGGEGGKVDGGGGRRRDGALIARDQLLIPSDQDLISCSTQRPPDVEFKS
ncbi:hypothetical protein BDZ89DRAFT_1034491 [Hymenopellis radicata]|nr:hypothetical protein BDZ89DRAFT_1034491 [Hymenopellis radicata]